MACEKCRLKKLKCDKAKPSCGRCRLRNLQCHYIGERKLKKLNSTEIEKRLFRMESLLRTMQNDAEPIAIQWNSSDTSATEACIQAVYQPTAANNLSPYSNSDHIPYDSVDADILPRNSSIVEAEKQTDHTRVSQIESLVVQSQQCKESSQLEQQVGGLMSRRNLLDDILSGKETSQAREKNAAVWIRTPDGDEYTGPSSGISLLSDYGLEWIRSSFDGAQEICGMLKSVTMDVASHLQTPKCMPSNPWASDSRDLLQKPLPAEEVVWEYVDGYFKHVQCILPVLDRPTFEEQLSTYFQDKNFVDPAWSALLNAVLASGCRAKLSAETPAAFEYSSHEGWSYFQNAVDLLAQLVYKPTSVMVVEALAVMTVYAQGLSSPQRLEYNFCVIAAQIAQGLGMHREPLICWNLTDYEAQKRNRLFWTIYILDKTISLRCGRPSVIDDDEISCGFPKGITAIQNNRRMAAFQPSGGNIEGDVYDIFLSIARYARICGRIAKALYSASALTRPSQDLLPIAAELEENLARWRDSIPAVFRPGETLRPSSLPSEISIMQALSLHFGYNDAICAICRRFSAMFVRSESQQLPEEFVRTTSTKCLEAARSMILLIKYLDIESHFPGWMLFYYPVTALIAIFINVVCHPQIESASNDIALMEVVIGHLGRLEFITAGGTAFNKIGELVRLGRQIVQTARGKGSPGLLWQSPTNLYHPILQPQVQVSHSEPHSSSPKGPNKKLSQFEERQNSLEKPQYGPQSVNMTSNPLGQPDNQQEITSFEYTGTVNIHTTESFLPNSGRPTNACLLGQDMIQWQIEQQDIMSHDWGLDSLDYAREGFHHRMPGDLVCSNMELS